MPNIAKLCDQIIAHLTAIGSPIAQFLRPGLSCHEIQEVEATLPFVFPDSLVEMYKWHNGTELKPGTTFFPWWGFDTIWESLERYRVLAVPQETEIWHYNWFPILSSSDISSIGISCSSSRKADGEITCFEYTADTRTEFVSLVAMLHTILQALEAGAIFMGARQELDIDKPRFSAIARRLNPSVKRWNE